MSRGADKVVLLTQQDLLEWVRSHGSHMWPSLPNFFPSASPPLHLAGFLLLAQKGTQQDGRDRQNRQRATSSEAVSHPALALPAVHVGEVWSGTK